LHALLALSSVVQCMYSRSRRPPIRTATGTQKCTSVSTLVNQLRAPPLSMGCIVLFRKARCAMSRTIIAIVQPLSGTLYVVWRGRPRPREGMHCHKPRGDSRPRLSGRAQLGEGLAGPRPRSKRVSFARDQKPTCIRQLSPGRGRARLQEAAEKLANVGLAVEERPFRAA